VKLRLRYAKANFAALAKQGVTFTNYYAVTHPSQPNYVASIGGDNFGIDNDDLQKIAVNVSTVIDLLEDKGVSWAEYEESMPDTGYQGDAYPNPDTGANMYVRKHNPVVIYNANVDNQDRLSRIKNMTSFYQDLQNDALPQWMFITPNMTSDGHDTSVTFAGQWAKNFLTPLLMDKRFMNNTIVLLTWDENETYTAKNRILSIVLGDAVPSQFKGTQDDTYYDHYSEVATVEANWDLHTLGRWDVGANVFSFVANKTGDQLRDWPEVTSNNPSIFLNESYPGPYNKANNSVPFPVPNVNAVVNGRTVLPTITSVWGHSQGNPIYNTGVQIPDGMHPPPGY
jgi:acid phosphatase